MEYKFLSAKQFCDTIRSYKYLYKDLWRENSTALILSPRGDNKSGRALEIAADIASSGCKVLYVNIDGNINKDASKLTASDSLMFFTPKYDSPDDSTDYADKVFEAIEQAVSKGIKAFVIDSISRIAALSFGKNSSAAYLMKRLVSIQMRYKISILALAHSSTKSAGQALAILADTLIPMECEESQPAREAEKKTDASGSSCNRATRHALTDRDFLPDNTQKPTQMPKADEKHSAKLLRHQDLYHRF